MAMPEYLSGDSCPEPVFNPAKLAFLFVPSFYIPVFADAKVYIP